MIARDRAEHAAKYQHHLIVPATDILQLLNERDTAENRLEAVRQLLADADRHQNAFIQTGHLRDALAALDEGGDDR